MIDSNIKKLLKRSTGVIEILNKVIQTVTKKEEESKEIVKLEPNYEGLWIITPFEEHDYWFLKTGYFPTIL